MKYLNRQITENKKEESDNNLDLRKISNFIEKRFKKDNKHNAIFVYWIAKMLDFKKIVFVSTVEMSEDSKDVKHVFIKIEDKYFDQRGFCEKEDIIEEFDLDEYNFKDLVYNGTIEDLQKVIKTKDIKIGEKHLKELQSIIMKFKN